MKIGILGGSFNPPHQGHIHISKLALQKMQLNQIWWIPTRQNPLKKFDNFLSFDQRIEACQKLTKNHPKIAVKKIENFYSFDLVNLLKKRYKKYDFIWIMGADNLPNLHRWRRFKQLINAIEFAIFSRDNFIIKNNNYPAIKLYKKYRRNRKKLPKITLYNSPKINISSTQIRQINV